MDEQTIGYKCPNCDATLEFKASGGTMHCDYCDSDFDVDTLKEYDEALKREKDEEEQGDPAWAGYDNGEWEEDGKAIFTCRSCAAELVADENTAATVCPYCGNATILTGRLSGMLKPDMVIPFKVEKEQQLALQVLQATLDGQLLFVLFYLGGSQTAGGVTA